jgi:hypothetical protein
MRKAAELELIYAGKSDPPVRKDGKCAVKTCQRRAVGDAFCSSPCCSNYFTPKRVALGDPA